MDIYLLVGESGEYEDRHETVFGVFSTRDAALKALEEIPKEAKTGWAAYCAFIKHYERLASQDGCPKVKKYILDQSVDERIMTQKFHSKFAEIKEREGPAPEFFCTADAYSIVQMKMDRLSAYNLPYDISAPDIKCTE